MNNLLFSKVDVAHPAAKSMIELSRAQDEEVGDGTTSVIILSEWLVYGGGGVVLLLLLVSSSLEVAVLSALDLSKTKLPITPRCCPLMFWFLTTKRVFICISEVGLARDAPRCVVCDGHVSYMYL